MNQNTYLEIIKKRLELYHEIKLPYSWRGHNYDLYAHHFQRGERYIATKKTVIYGIEANRHIFLTSVSGLTRDRAQLEVNHLTNDLNRLIQPHDEHMSSLLELVFLSPTPVCQDTIEYIEKTSFYKSFWLGLHGWVHLGLLLVDLSDHKIYTNSKGKEDLSLFTVKESPK